MSTPARAAGPPPASPLLEVSPSDPAPAAPAPPVWCSEDLLGDAQEVRIKHGNVVYTLRRTNSGKLILVK